MNYAIATSRPWNEIMARRLQERTGHDFHLINRKDDLSLEKLSELKPRYIFFPHWSYIVPEEIFNSFECVIFHMTDLPYGRGGSPLQNLIQRGHRETKISALLLDWLAQGHCVAWAHDAVDLPGGDLCFYLSYGSIVDSEKRSCYQHNLVVHESDLPQGRGWSPLTWQILEGRNRIPLTLFEAVDTVDAGLVYLQEWIDFQGNELVDELRAGQGEATVSLCRRFVLAYPEIVDTGQEQTGEASYYARRRPAHSRLDADKTIREQFNHLRVVDNERYPAFFDFGGKRFLITICKKKQRFSFPSQVTGTS
jgi:methionyl-tRNA formyltransferase